MSELFSNNGPSRRRFLQLGLTGTAAGLMAGGLQLTLPSPARAQSILTPDAALTELVDGNKRFIAEKLTSFDHDLAILKQHTVEKQEPFAAVLSCADSRVPVELVFDQSIGHIFVTRVAGNVITPEIIGSLEYGVAVLGTKVILVMGHSGCGAVKATMQGKESGRCSLFPTSNPGWIRVARISRRRPRPMRKIQATLLREASTVIASMVKEGKLKVLAGYYALIPGPLNSCHSVGFQRGPDLPSGDGSYDEKRLRTRRRPRRATGRPATRATDPLRRRRSAGTAGAVG